MGKKDPLGLLCWGSFTARDLWIQKRIYPHRVGEMYRITPAEGHRWMYYPNMKGLEECLLIKTYDSRKDASGSFARFGPHASFSDPDVAADAPARESIELRC